MQAALVSGQTRLLLCDRCFVTRPALGKMTSAADGNCRPRTVSRSLFITSPRFGAMFRLVLMLLLA